MSIISKNMAVVNQILPHKNKWAWDLFIAGCANNWMPTEISMAKDIEQWKKKDFLSEDERLVIKRCLGFFAGSESLVSNNLLINIFRYITDAECRQYIIRQTFEEALHNLTIVYVCDSLNLDIKEVYEAYQTIPAIKAKDDFLLSIIGEFGKKDVDPDTLEGQRDILRNIITYYVICEGIFFYSGFALLLAFGRQNKIPGISEQIHYTLRDETNHLEFGRNLIRKIRDEHPRIFSKDFQKEIVDRIKTAVELEVAYSRDVLPNGILGMNSDMFMDYVYFIGNRRLESLELDFRFPSDKNPFPWLSETIDLSKCKNFFESRVLDYKTGVLNDDF